MKHFMITVAFILFATITVNSMDKKIIRISTERTDLVLQVAENGRLYQSYLGERLLNDADLDEQFAQIPGGRPSSPGRPHFAAALLKKYPERFRDWDDVFAKLLKRGAPAFVERKLPMITDVLEVIRKAGGVAIWAHPVYRSRNERAFVRRMLKRFVPEGLDGVEAYYSLYGVDESAMLNDFAAEFGLARSGGSDYHGKNSPKIELGSGAGKLRVPDELLESLLLRRREKYGIAG